MNPDWGTTNAIGFTVSSAQTGVVVFADGTHDIGGWYVFNNDRYEQAYWTRRDLNETWRFVLFNGGIAGGTSGPTIVQWKLSSTDGTYYNPGGNVHLMGVDPLSPLGVVAKHEYGHNVMYNIYGNYMPPNPELQSAHDPGCPQRWLRLDGRLDRIPDVGRQQRSHVLLAQRRQSRSGIPDLGHLWLGQRRLA